MEKVIQLIREKKAKLENIIYKAELIPNPTRDIVRLINEYKDECSQLTEAELLLNTESRKNGKPLDRNIGNAM